LVQQTTSVPFESSVLKVVKGKKWTERWT